jgi:hypothetical protein
MIPSNVNQLVVFLFNYSNLYLNNPNIKIL